MAAQPQVRLAHRGDGYDIWHTILGSTAEVFVTFDQRLANHIARVPTLDGPELRVVRSVRDLPGLHPFGIACRFVGGIATAVLRMAQEIDVRHVLPMITYWADCPVVEGPRARRDTRTIRRTPPDKRTRACR